MSVRSISMGGGAFGSLLLQIGEGLRQNRVALLLALALNLGDAISTHIGLASGVPEGNPIPAMLLAKGGEMAWLGAKFAVVTMVVLMVCLLGKRYPKLWYTFTVTNLVLLVAVLSNSAQLLAQ